MTEELDIFADIGEAAENAEKFAVRSYFGKCTVTVNRYTQWVDHQPVEVDAAAYRKLAMNEKSMELLFSVDIEELKPDIGFKYERKVTIGQPDWNKIVMPSLKKLFGKGEVGEIIKKVTGTYVHAKDVPQIKSAEFSTIKFEAFFDNKDQCVAAADKLFGGGSSDTAATVTTATVTISDGAPEGYTKDVWDALVEGEIKPELAKGVSAPELAKLYGVPVPVIAQLKV